MALDELTRIMEFVMQVKGFVRKRMTPGTHDLTYYEFDKRASKEGRTVILVHGLGNSSLIWTKIFNQFAKGDRVLAMDLPSFGGSPPPAGKDHATVPDICDALIAFMEEDGQGPYTVVAHSLGGWASMWAAAKRPELMEQLILLNTAGVLYPQVTELSELMMLTSKEEVRAFWRRLWHRIPLVNQLFVGEYIDRMEAPRVRKLLDSMVLEHFINDELAGLQVPMSIVWGDEDRFLPRSSVDTLIREVQEARVAWLPECGHIPQLEQPRLLMQVLRPWVEAPMLRPKV